LLKNVISPPTWAFCGCDDLSVFEHPQFFNSLLELKNKK